MDTILTTTIPTNNISYTNHPPATIDTPELRSQELYPLYSTLQQHTYTSPQMGVAELSDVLYCPRYEILLTSDYNVLSESDPYGMVLESPQANRWQHITSTPPVTLLGTYAICRGMPRSYYHQLIDHLPRMVILAEHTAGKFPTLLHSTPLDPWEKFFIPRLTSGTETKKIDHSKMYRIEKLLFPLYVTRPGAGYIPPPIRQTILRIAKIRKHSNTKRIYISRKKRAYRNRRHITNESELIEAIKPYGFTSYTLENMSLQTQFTLFAQADIVIGAHGAGLSNLLFSDSASVIELHPQKKIAPHYFYVAKSSNSTHFSMQAENPYLHQNFAIDTPAIRALLPQIIK